MIHQHVYIYILYIYIIYIMFHLFNRSSRLTSKSFRMQENTQENVNQLGELRGRRLISSMGICLIKPMSSDPLCEGLFAGYLGLFGRIFELE